MTDLRRGLGLCRNHLRYLDPVRRSDGTCVGTKNSLDFDFWSEQRSTNYENYDDLGVGEVEDESGAETEDYYGAHSPRLWRSRNVGYEASPLLPYKHCHSYASPKSRLQAIIDGRRELMEMVKDLPESSYELSLKDMVDERHGVRHKEEDMSEGKRNQILETKVKGKKKRIGRKEGQMLRSESMDSGVFLLKMFFPTSLAAKKKQKKKKKKKPTEEHCPKVSPRASLEGSEKPAHKGWWKIRLLVTGEHKQSARTGVNGSTGSSRNAESNLTTPGCWFFCTTKCKLTEQQDCIF